MPGGSPVNSGVGTPTCHRLRAFRSQDGRLADEWILSLRVAFRVVCLNSPYQSEVGLSVQVAVPSLSGLNEPDIFSQKVAWRLGRKDAQVYFMQAVR